MRPHTTPNQKTTHGSNNNGYLENYYRDYIQIHDGVLLINNIVQCTNK